MKHSIREGWRPSDITRMLTNPYYTGLKVHPDLAVQRPVYREKFIQMARESIQTSGAKQFLRELLAVLQQPDEWARQVILVHKRFTEKHPAIISEEDFIGAGAIQIRDLGSDVYCDYFLNNLESGGVDYGYELR